MTQPQHAPIVHASANATEQAAQLAHELAQCLRHTIDQQGHALMAVSGGKSPVPLFQQLREQSLNWARVTLLLVDERCVPAEHPDSNTALVRQHLLQGPAAAARFVPCFDEHTHWPATPPTDTDLNAWVTACNQRLATLDWPLDMALLGMGEDGHTASLFAGAQGLEQARTHPGPMAWTRPETAPHARLTLTLPRLLEARSLVLPLSGSRKRAVFEQACEQATPQAPISWLIHQARHPLQVWMVP